MAWGLWGFFELCGAAAASQGLRRLSLSLLELSGASWSVWEVTGASGSFLGSPGAVWGWGWGWRCTSDLVHVVVPVRAAQF